MAASHAQALADSRGVSYKGQRRDWRKNFKLRCLQQVKKQRERQRNANRGIDNGTTDEDVEGYADVEMKRAEIAEAMTTQFERLQQQVNLESNDTCSRAMPYHYSSTASNDYTMDAYDEEVDIVNFTLADHDELLRLWDEIEEELLLEDAAEALDHDDICEQAEDVLQAENDELEAALELHDENSVTCPMCHCRLLKMTGCIVHCDCGFRLNTQNESMSLSNFDELLTSCVSEHQDSGCRQPLRFSTNNEMLATRTCTLLQATCDACGFFSFL
eukprot:TRINITY_DN27058_c0_g1_i1.p1 TRINITY_DN27058_c0_g1~~TRINITY_DN27058_c0_g1_i1.p1  ORF type:complete len:273 (+),score=48.83 TRINITY_DN27058_c0_g1_i1:64-882(+)